MSKIYDKIQKLLALGNRSSFEGEAETALKMAHQLMSEYGITMSDLDEVGRERELGKLGEWGTEPKAFKVWERSLAAAIAKLFDSELVISFYNRKQILYFIGREGNVRTAMIMYSWIKDKLWSDAKKKFVPYSASACNSYCAGATNTIWQRIFEMKEKDEQEGWGLVVINEAKQYKIQLHPSLKKGNHSSIVSDRNAYGSGREDGKKIGLNKQFGLKTIA